MFSPKCLIELFLKSNRSIDKTSYQAARSIVELVRRPAAACGPSGRMRPEKTSLRNHDIDSLLSMWLKITSLSLNFFTWIAWLYDLFLKLEEKKEHTNVPQNFLSLSISLHEYHGVHACSLSQKNTFYLHLRCARGFLFHVGLICRVLLCFE